MAKLNITQAAKTVGVHRSTIQRHIKQGLISCQVNGNGEKVIDTAELIRHYGELKEPATPDAVLHDDAMQHHATPDATGILQEKISLLEQHISELQKDKEEWRKDKEKLYHEKEELMTLIKQQQTLLLTHEPKKRRGFFSRLFGG
ncbi:DNA-binding protein [Candidatus Poribacteria bacterium]|nr:DNA-binding protein [Candidatus Poribacteria bacterium]